MMLALRSLIVSLVLLVALVCADTETTTKKSVDVTTAGQELVQDASKPVDQTKHDETVKEITGKGDDNKRNNDNSDDDSNHHRVRRQLPPNSFRPITPRLFTFRPPTFRQITPRLFTFRPPTLRQINPIPYVRPHINFQTPSPPGSINLGSGFRVEPDGFHWRSRNGRYGGWIGYDINNNRPGFRLRFPFPF